ncbi:hypothetical protein [Micromonospora sp. SL4-19]|uniref:hypothetical protein n=1 Tax=Micromonospora sp. SL4-19 TaxID=3399129 RepID=UPI003A4DF096
MAFAVLLTIGLGWAAFGGWAVTRRAPMFAQDRVVAGWLGLGAWLLFTVGGLVITTLRHKLEPSLVVVELALGVLAIANLRTARRAGAALLPRKEQLSQLP